MQKSCKNCNQQFQIREEDREYYIKMDVPEPSFCPPCREMRRMAWCNEMYLYPNICRLCGKNIIAQFDKDNPRPAYCVECWWSDKWNPLAYAREIDWNRPFLEQLHELELAVPHSCVSTDIGNINSEYTHHAGQEKNCYLIFHSTFAEDCYYGYGVKKSKNCVDTHYCHQSDFCYECIDIKDCNALSFSQDCFSCSSSAFLYDCVSCMDCFMCAGLRNKKYHFLNEPLTQEEYKKRLLAVNLGSSAEVQKYLKQFEDLKKKHPRRFLQQKQVENSLGDHITNAKDAWWCFDCSDIEKSEYCSQMQLGVRYCRDIYQYGINAELCYESAMVGTNAYNIRFCYLCLWQVSDLTYCIESYNSKECFGCFGLKRNKYCILNKEYTEKEYFDLKKQLIEKMKKDGEWGQFLPVQYSQSAYNETSAQLWYPLSKEEVLAKGWRWQENLPGTYGKETQKELPDDIKEVPDSITREVLLCGHCGKNYRIIPQELAFYRGHKYPLPGKCFECRRIERMKKRNPRKFWERECMCDRSGHKHQGPCREKFQTSYSPDRPEIVYCEKCYLEAVY